MRENGNPTNLKIGSHFRGNDKLTRINYDLELDIIKPARALNNAMFPIPKQDQLREYLSLVYF
jgi:hypothetical protein